MSEQKLSFHSLIIKVGVLIMSQRSASPVNLAYSFENEFVYRTKYCIRRNIGSDLIWQIAESLCLVDFKIGGEARGHVSNTLTYTDEIISRI